MEGNDGRSSLSGCLQNSGECKISETESTKTVDSQSKTVFKQGFKIDDNNGLSTIIIHAPFVSYNYQQLIINEYMRLGQPGGGLSL